ncbi:MAG: ARMT1-like domain-containing protein [Campylobacterota bacterium]|nr:ARMT1-like domain-containing protein [Campylobacterota bacterium]
MKTKSECILCFINQALRASNIIGASEEKKMQAAISVIKYLSNVDLAVPPPVISEGVYSRIKKVLNNDDPYKKVKQHFTEIAFSYLPQLKKTVKKSKSPIDTAVRLSLAGNVVDFGSQMEQFDVEDAINTSLSTKITLDDSKIFIEELKKAKNLFFVADNAGEIVFDKLLLQTIKEVYPEINIKTVARESPIINDITIDEMKAINMQEIGELLSSGAAIPGLDISRCSEKCKKAFYDADIIISKGQGNFEILSELNDNRIYFLFIVKCSVIARYMNLPLLSRVFSKKREWQDW